MENATPAPFNTSCLGRQPGCHMPASCQSGRSVLGRHHTGFKWELSVQVVRRLFLLVGTAALVACKAGSGGVDVALGPNVGCSPLGLLGPAAILHGLVAGPGTEDPRMTTAALPVVRLSLLPTAQGSCLIQAIGKVCAWCRTPSQLSFILQYSVLRPLRTLHC